MRKPRVLIVCVNENSRDNFNYYVDELINLCDAANFEVVESILQNLPKIDKRQYIGTGKIEEVKFAINDIEDIDLVVTLHELSGSQNRNLEKLLEVKIMDRTQLILEIFNVRAQTKEAKLQVAIASLQYNMPRMIGSYDNLDRQGGGKVGTLSRGSGEKKIETDKRVIRDQIAFLKQELQQIVKSRDIQRNHRANNGVKVVAVVGYTNAGKSTLMNALVNTERQVFEKDMLFATLQTSVRQIKLANNHEFLLVDTVGFVSDLPHELVNAFRSTLEEVCEADLIIHLHDLSNPFSIMHDTAVNQTLKKIGADKIPQLNVYNKIDLVEKYHNFDNAIYISAKQKLGLELFLDTVDQRLFGQIRKYHFELNYKELHFLDLFHKTCTVTNEFYHDNGVSFDILLSDEQFLKYQHFLSKEYISKR